MIAAGVLAWVLNFTPPARDAVRCDSLAGPCVDLRDYLLERHQGSPFYFAHRDSMLDNRTPFFTAHWATVTMEAAWQGVVRFLAPGLVVTDTSRAWEYAVSSRDSSGNVSCRSNEVHPP